MLCSFCNYTVDPKQKTATYWTDYMKSTSAPNDCVSTYLEDSSASVYQRHRENGDRFSWSTVQNWTHGAPWTVTFTHLTKTSPRDEWRLTSRVRSEVGIWDVTATTATPAGQPGVSLRVPPPRRGPHVTNAGSFFRQVDSCASTKASLHYRSSERRGCTEQRSTYRRQIDLSITLIMCAWCRWQPGSQWIPARPVVV